MEHLGRYKLVERIAIGGMAEIFLAEQPGPAGFSRRVAIKRILPHRSDDAEFVEMFLNEARLSALLNHPNIVQIYDLGETEGAYYIAMEFVDGVDLGQLLDKSEERRELIPAPYIARIMAQAASGLNYAHAYCDPQTAQPLNLIHRDISLPNIMLSREGVVKLLDFGIAKAATTEQRAPTQTGVLKGKISYMSPEYLMAEPIDWRHDLFALGVVMFELATGQKPFQAKGDMQMLQAILTQPPRDPGSLNPMLPRSFVDILLRMLAKDRNDRFQNGAEIQGALDHFIYDAAGGEITHAHLATFIKALFAGEPIPSPNQLAEASKRRPHQPQPSHAGLQRVPGHVQAHPVQESQGWMEETRALSLNTGALAGLSDNLTPGNDPIEQTAVLKLDALGNVVNQGVGGEQPMTRELDESMLPPLPADDILEPQASPETKELSATTIPPAGQLGEAPTMLEQDLQLTPPPTLQEEDPPPTPPEEKASGGSSKLFLGLVFLCLLCGGLAVFVWFYMRGDDPNPNPSDGEPDTVVLKGSGVRPNPKRSVRKDAGAMSPTQARPDARPKVRPSGRPPLPAFKRKSGEVGSAPTTDSGPPLPVFGRRNPPAAPDKDVVAPPPNRRLKYGVYLKSYPRCTVYWNGRKWGQTPIELSMPPGTHNLILRRGKPYIRYPYKIILQEQEYLQKTVYIREGFLDIRATPWGKVTVDGHYIGRTPLSPIRLFAGYHRVRISKGRRSIFRSVFIYPDRKSRLRHRFRR